MPRQSYAVLLLALLVSPAQARRYPVTTSDSSGTWIGTRRGLLHGTGELFKRYDADSGLPSAQVNDVELAPNDVWVATPRGLARLNKGSRRWETFGTPELPAQHVTSVSVDPSDPDKVWVGTAAGLARYDVRTNQWQRVTSGLPSPRVNDVLFRGRTLWVATDAGLAAYDVKLRTFTTYRQRDGLAGDRALEIEELGNDLWVFGEGGLSRVNPQRRTIVGLRKDQGLPGARILATARLQNLIYIATDGGLITYDVTADSLAPFLFAKGLPSPNVRSVLAAGGFVWFATDKGLARFDPTKKAWEYYRVEDGLSTEDLQELAAAGSRLLIFGAENLLDTYDPKKDEWVDRSELLPAVATSTAGDGAATQPTSGPASAPAAAPPKRLTLSVSAELDTELKQDLSWPAEGPFEREGYWLLSTLRLGAGAQWASGRKVDLSGRLDWGDISPIFVGQGATLRSFQDYDLDLRYLGQATDVLQEVRLSDEIRLEDEGGLLTERTEVEGGRVVLAAGAKREEGRAFTVHAAAGLRRGTPVRVVFSRPAVASLQIKRFKLFRYGKDGASRDLRQIIPGSVRALLDGRELERNVDYFVDHDNGVLWIKNTDLIDALRVLEVEFEYLQIPRKNIGAVSMADMLPKDGDIGQLKRSGRARWAKDEQGLFDEIDGGAEQFINRGWDQTVSQDYEWSSAGIILRIHDMGTDKDAQAIFLARKLPDAKPVPGLTDVFLERQTASLSVKLVRGQHYVELSIDQASMEQEILAIAGWLVSKLAVSGSTSADALRDLVTAAGADVRFTDRTRVGLSYLGTLSVEDAEIARREGALRGAHDVIALHAMHRQALWRDAELDARVQGAGSISATQGQSDRTRGGAVLGRLALTSPQLVLRATGRKYTAGYGGIGIARQTEFCRTAERLCLAPDTSQLDHELGADATLNLRRWLPLGLTYQRQTTALGSDYADAPAGRALEGIRDTASARLSFEHHALPKLSAAGGFIRRSDPFAERQLLRTSGTAESDLGAGLLKGLKFKRIYLRGLYEYGTSAVDEFADDTAAERDRRETMHHGVGELRLAPTLTESGYATIEYHRLRGALDAAGQVVDQLTYWRLDAGAGSSVIPGLALRFDAALWLGDDQPLPLLDATAATEAERQQEANSRLAGVLDVFPGDWLKPLSPLKLNAAYTYTLQTNAAGRRSTRAPLGEEVCEAPGDEDGDGLADCADPDCAFADACLFKTAQIKSHRAYGTLTWDTPGKLQLEVFGDVRLGFTNRDDALRSTRQELRSFATWRPIYPSPITLRFDLLRETKRPEEYDGILPLVEPRTLQLEPALEWRRRWSARWWHLAKLTVTHTRISDLPHIRTIEDAFGRKGDLERLDYADWAIKPSLEVRRRFEDEQGRWNFRPYARASYRYRVGEGISSRIGDTVCRAGEPCLADGSETGHLFALSLGLIWVHSENAFVDLDLSTSYNLCVKAPTGAYCNDKLAFSPHLLATIRY